MPLRTRIKICGLTQEADVDAAVEAGADAIGLVFYPRSPRYVTLQRAEALTRRLAPFMTPVGLFVNADEETVRAACDAIPHLVLQFHGDETPQACEQYGRPYLRAARMTAEFDLLHFAARYASAQALLLDAHVEGYGGGGKAFDWSLIPPSVPRPVVLSGGLTPANVIGGILQVRPWAVDVSSGVESARGIKDAVAIRRFCEAVREADARDASAGA
ncbi:phosphoribosylanthranilate isomerase [Caldimonas brevitalea]|uniref:N-(5'-phosphoribosyl)anthranilate isomerase n=1 Tax=Caldimonas brevitalea TaxID=413882 RepID=A0A0G3BLQ3_9BURK|nr:phosphoribosylanthranilate isomerase [Caldimonas brevitalea]AKJ28281.1 N-(5'-phosphoribosyl)anthranilate isomerase [Caldimonas brevitalea]